MQIPILNGITGSPAGEFRTSYPRNLVPVPKQTGIAAGYLRPADGLLQFAVGPGVDRGGFNWNGALYRVMGTKLVRIEIDGTVSVLGDVGAGGTVSMDDGGDHLSIWSGGRLYFLSGSTLAQVEDPDLGVVIDGVCIAGYELSTDGTYLIVNELADRMQVNPLKYGSAESDPDSIKAVDELRNEAYALGRYTIEVFENVGGAGFPFQRIEGAMVAKGVIGTHAYSQFAGTLAFLGSGRNEAPAVYLMAPGDAQKISTAEIDQQLLGYTEEQLSAAVLESKVDKGHEWLMIHLPDVCWVFDLAATKAAQEPIWFSLDSGLMEQATYRARGLVWCYDRWLAGDPTGTAVVAFSDSDMDHFGARIGWDFGGQVVYNGGRGAVFHNLELVALPGRVALGADPVIWTSYSLDGETWSQERPCAAGKQGERLKRIAWRKQGKMRHYRMQRFRGTSDARLSIARLEVELEALNG